MKKNKNLAIVSCALLALTAVTATTATYAWFTVSRNATGNINDVAVKADGDLEVRLVTSGTMGAGDNWRKAGEGLDEDLEKFATTTLTDISGDGVDFYRVVLDATNPANYTKINKASTDNYIRFTLQFRSTAQNLALYIGSDTSLLAKGSENSANLSDALRMAYFDTTSTTTTNLDEAPTAGQLKAVYSKSSFTDEKYITKSEGEAPVEGSKPLSGAFKGEFSGDKQVVSGVQDKPYHGYVGEGTFSPVIAELTQELEDGATTYYTATVNIAIWLEGNDSSCVTTYLANDTTIDAVLNFYALDMVAGA